MSHQQYEDQGFKQEFYMSEQLKQLRQPFPAHQINYLPKGNAKLAYVGHAALTERLLDVDPAWTWEPLAMNTNGLPVMDELGGMWIRLTVCGVTRLGYGHAGAKTGGDAIKEVIGDALRNAAMRFGCALELWHKGDLHKEDDGEADKRADAREHWLADQFIAIDSAANAGEFKRIVAEALQVATKENDADAIKQINAHAGAKAATAKAKAEQNFARA